MSNESYEQEISEEEQDNYTFQLYAISSLSEDTSGTAKLERLLLERGYFKTIRNGFGDWVVLSGYAIASFVEEQLVEFEGLYELDPEAGCAYIYTKNRACEEKLKKLYDTFINNPQDLLTLIDNSPAIKTETLNKERLELALKRKTPIYKSINEINGIKEEHQMFFYKKRDIEVDIFGNKTFDNMVEVEDEELDDVAYFLYSAYRKMEAVHALANCIYLNKALPWAYNMLGYILYEFGALKESIYFYKLAIENKDETVYNNLSISYYDLGEFEEALFYSRKACELGEIYAFNVKANIYLQLSNKEEAIKALHEGLECAKNINNQEELEFYDNRIKSFQ